MWHPQPLPRGGAGRSSSGDYLRRPRGDARRASNAPLVLPLDAGPVEAFAVEVLTVVVHAGGARSLTRRGGRAWNGTEGFGPCAASRAHRPRGERYPGATLCTSEFMHNPAQRPDASRSPRRGRRGRGPSPRRSSAPSRRRRGACSARDQAPAGRGTGLRRASRRRSVRPARGSRPSSTKRARRATRRAAAPRITPRANAATSASSATMRPSARSSRASRAASFASR